MATRFYADRSVVIDELDWWARALRDLAVAAAAPDDRGLESVRDAALTPLTGRLGAREAIEAARATQQTALLLEQNVHPRIALDVLVLDLPGLAPS
jgi:hypothetical protein